MYLDAVAVTCSLIAGGIQMRLNHAQLKQIQPNPDLRQLQFQLVPTASGLALSGTF
jgi:hypothetical protein